MNFRGFPTIQGLMDQENKNVIFREWVNQYYEFGFRIAFRILGNLEESRDIVQDSFLKVWLKYDLYDNKLKFSTWLYRIITNLCLDRLRRKKIIDTHASQGKNSCAEELFSVEKQMEDKEIRDALNKLSEHLSPKQKIVFVLRDLEELEMSEVCNITNMNEDQVKSNLYHARKAIRESVILVKILEGNI